MTKEAAEARALYMKKYRQDNKDRLNEYRREWAKRNPEKIKSYTAAQWERKARENSQQS